MYHVINRGNAHAEVFHKDGDYDAFVRLLADAHERLPMRVVAYCLMPNHFHLVLWPHADGDLSRWMQWLLTAHVCRYHQHYHGSGHVWQGRFKAFPIQADEYLLAVLRYVERNALRAELVKKAELWQWSSLVTGSLDLPPAFLHPGPVPRPKNWLSYVETPITAAELARVRHSVARGAPYGDDAWMKRAAARLGLEASLRPRGRPKKQPEK